MSKTIVTFVTLNADGNVIDRHKGTFNNLPLSMARRMADALTHDFHSEGPDGNTVRCMVERITTETL